MARNCLIIFVLSDAGQDHNTYNSICLYIYSSTLYTVQSCDNWVQGITVTAWKAPASAMLPAPSHCSVVALYLT